MMERTHHLQSIHEEINVIKKSGFLTREELRMIQEKRKEFEHLINKSVKNVQDHKDYIHFENIILKQIMHSEKKCADKNVSTMIKKRMKCLYDKAVQRFPSDIELCFSYFNFCRQSNFVIAAGAAAQNLIKINPYNPEVWQLAADFFLKDRNNLDVAIKILQKGLVIHKDSQILYIEIIKMNIQAIANHNCTDVTNEAEIEERKTKMCTERLKPYLDLIFDNLDSSEFLMSVLTSMEHVSFTKNVQAMIIEKLQKYCSDESVSYTLVKYLKEQKKINLAIDTVNLGLVSNSKSEILYKEAIYLQLSLLTNHDDAMDGSFEATQEICYNGIKNYVNSICNNMYDHTFFITVLDILKPYSFTEDIRETIIEKLTNNPGNEERWATIAKYLKDDDKVDDALNVLRKGLEFHNESQLLITEYVQLELSNLRWDKNKVENDENQVAKEKCCCENIARCLNVMLESVEDHNFLIDLLDMLSSYDFTKAVQDEIVTKLLKTFPYEEMVWHCLAQREKRGLHYVTPDHLESQVKSKFILCIEKYEEGLKKVPHSRRASLWILYLDYLLEMSQDMSVAQMSKTNALKTAFEEAHRQNCLEERHYIIWLELLDVEEKSKILEKATTSLPQSISLWKMRLKHYMKKNDEIQVRKVFKLGVLSLKEKALPLWQMTITFYTAQVKPAVVHLIYKDGVKQPEEVCNALKPRYLEWLLLNQGMNSVRKTYNLIAYTEPFCKELHTVMAKLESTESEYNYETWESSLQLACQQFGENDIEVWLEYMKFFLDIHKVNDMEKRIQTVFKDAQTYLNPVLMADFKAEFDRILSIRR